MNIIIDDIWKFHNGKTYIIIPTNLGFTKEKRNVCGRGLALQCKNKFIGIEKSYGNILYKRFLNNDTRQIVFDNINKLIFFPTKPLNKDNPHLSWQQDSSLETIEKSCHELSGIFKSNQLDNPYGFREYKFLLPLVGCGNGNLKPKEVIPILFKYFDSFDNVFLVERNNYNDELKKELNNEKHV